MNCSAPNKVFQSDFKPYTKSESLPWGNAKPGSEEYFRLFTEAAVELTNKSKITLVKAYVELVKQGWDINAYELDDDVRKALEEAGLTASSSTVEQDPYKGQAEGYTPSSPTNLDEIIKAMQEEQK